MNEIEELAEFKRQLKSDPEKAKRFADESRRLAEEMEARLRGRQRQALSLEEMRAYIDKVKKEIEEQRMYRRLPWWKRLFRDRPVAG